MLCDDLGDRRQMTVIVGRFKCLWAHDLLTYSNDRPLDLTVA